jgi:hypothetical protein
MRCKHPVHLLGERLMQIARPETGLHMRHRGSRIEGRQRAAERGCISLHDHHAGALGVEHVFESRQDPRRGLEQSLTRQHEIQVVVRFHFESLEHLVQHSAMLRSDAHLDIELCGRLAKAASHGAELYRFRPCTEDQKDLVH